MRAGLIQQEKKRRNIVAAPVNAAPLAGVRLWTERYRPIWETKVWTRWNAA